MDSRAGERQEEHARIAARTYTAAADHYLHPALGFWDQWGSKPGSTDPSWCCRYFERG